MQRSGVPHQVPWPAAQHEEDPEGALPIPRRISGWEAAAEPRQLDDEKRQAHLGEIGAQCCANLRTDGRTLAALGEERDRRYLPPFLLGRQRSNRTGEMHGRLANLLPANRAWRAGPQRPQACGIRAADAVAVAPEDRPQPRMERATDSDILGGASILQIINLHQARRWQVYVVLGRPLDRWSLRRRHRPMHPPQGLTEGPLQTHCP